MANPKEVWAFPALNLQWLIVGSVTAVYPSYNLAGLKDKVLDIWRKAFEPYEVCLPTANILFGPLTADLTKKGWQNAPEVEAWANLTRVGNKRFAGPLLIIAGDDDTWSSSDGMA